MDNVVIAQPPEPEREVLQRSAINLTIAKKLNFQEIKDAIKSHAEAKRHTVLLDTAFSALEKLGIDKAEELRKPLQIPDDELMKKLGLKKKTEPAAFKRLAKLVFEELE